TCCVAGAAPPLAAIFVRPTATSSRPTPPGSSPVCGWRATSSGGRSPEHAATGAARRPDARTGGGEAARGDPGGPDASAEGAAEQALLRRARLGALRGDHAAPGVLPHSDGAGAARGARAALGRGAAPRLA